MPEMKLSGYIKTLIIGYIVIFAVNAVLSLCGVCSFSVWFAAYYPLLIILAYVILNLVAALLCRVVPEDKINVNAKLFRTFKFERKFYETLGVRKFKDKIPDVGAAFGFSKSEVSSIDAKYIEKFIKSTIIGEIAHILGLLSCFIVFLIFNDYVLNFSLPCFLLNTYFNILPIFVQRYNRPKLYRIYSRQIAQSEEKIEDVIK